MKTQELKMDLSQLSALKTYSKFLKKEKLEQMARESGFVARSDSKLTGQSFLEMSIENIHPNQEWSLNDQCDYLREHFDISLRKQSLDERYNTNAVSFIKACYDEILHKQFRNVGGAIATSFDAIYLTDGTSWQLPAHLAPFYQSNGGSTTGSSIKVHQTIELLGFRIADLLVTDGKQADQKYWEQKKFIPVANSLWIADLGYFSWKTFTEIAHADAFFLSRYKTGTALWIKDKHGAFVPLDLPAYLRRKVKQHTRTELVVYFGKDKIESRLICEAVPDHVKQERLKEYARRYQNQSKKATRQWAMTAAKKILAGYNLYITNASVEQLPMESVFHVYTLRWQIEILFKIWKSILYIDKTIGMSIFRFECFLYSRLMFLLLSTELMSFIKSTLSENDLEIELSDWKLLKLIKKTSLV